MKLILRSKISPARTPATRARQVLDDVDAQPPRATGGDTVDRVVQKKVATYWGIGLVATGVFAVVVSLLGEASWADAGTSIGTGFVIAGFVFVLEPRLVRDVSEAAGSVATQIVDASTAEIRARVERLENLGELQDRVAEDRGAATSDLVDRVREQPDFESTVDLLESAEDLRLFSDLRLRSGSDPRMLMSLAWEPSMSDVEKKYPDCDPDFFVDNPQFRDHILIGAILPTEEVPVAESQWFSEQSLEDAWKEFLDACEREDVPTRDFELALVFQLLAESYETMLDSRRSPPSNPGRLRGRLILLINSEWAITEAGMESRIGGFCSESCPDGVEHCPTGHDESLWKEAVFYARLVM